MAYNKDYSIGEDNSSSGAVWNFDDAESQLLFMLKSKFIDAMIEWRHEDAYQFLRNLIAETDALLTDKERTDIDDNLKTLTQIRTEHNNNLDELHDEEKGDYHQELEEAYKEICLDIKTHGLYFREKAAWDGL